MADAIGGLNQSVLSGTLSDTSASLPAWLQEYTRGLAGKANTVAGGEYQPYQAPTNVGTYGQDVGRIAGFNPQQTQAFSNVQANQQSWKPYTDVASQTLPQAIGGYMNPYTDSVVNRIAQLGQRNLTENLLPQVNSTFTGAGQFGSTRNADFTSRAVRDANESILGQQANALQTGYQNAASNALADLQRQSNLGQMVSNLGYTDATMLGQVGQQQQAQTQANLDLANQDWQNQNNWQKQNLDWFSQILRGLPSQSSTYTTNTATPSTVGTVSPLAAAWQGMLGTRAAVSPQVTTTQTTAAK